MDSPSPSPSSLSHSDILSSIFSLSIDIPHPFPSSSDSLPLVSFPVCFFIILCYLTIIFSLKSLVQSRSLVGVGLFSLRILLFLQLFHNIICLFWNGFLFIGLIEGVGKLRGWSYNEIPLAYGPSLNEIHNEEIRQATLKKFLYLYFVSKVWEMMDTILFLLRGNIRQLSFLHVYHHSSMFIIWLIVMKYHWGGDAYTGPLINSGVHCIMYSYYLWCIIEGLVKGKGKKESDDDKNKKSPVRLTPFNPSYWRQFITRIQLLQHFVVIAQSVYCAFLPARGEYVFSTDEKHRHFLFSFICGSYMMTIFALFANFYKNNYSKKEKDERLKGKSDVSENGNGGRRRSSARIYESQQNKLE